MPVYVYVEILDDGSDGEMFEITQRMTDPALTEHPETGRPVKRVIQPPNLPLSYGESATKNMLDNKNLERLGLTKYERAGGGVYEKKTGKGPRTISAD